jgi:hypothetical protein
MKMMIATEGLPYTENRDYPDIAPTKELTPEMRQFIEDEFDTELDATIKDATFWVSVFSTNGRHTVKLKHLPSA